MHLQFTKYNRGYSFHWNLLLVLCAATPKVFKGRQHDVVVSVCLITRGLVVRVLHTASTPSWHDCGMSLCSPVPKGEGHPKSATKREKGM